MGADRLKIIQVTPWSVHGTGTGGMASVVRDLSAELRAQGHYVQIVTNDWNSPKPTDGGSELRLRLSGAPTTPGLFVRLKWAIHRERAARALLSLCRRESIDVIHAHFAGPYLTTLARARALGGPPYVVTCHRGDVLAFPDLESNQHRAVMEGVHKASAQIAVSDWLARQAATTFALDYVETIPNGFKAPWTVAPPRIEVECDLGRKLPDRYAVLVANMRPYKGHSVALDAWRMLKERSDLPLVFVGSGPDFEVMRALTHEYDLEDKVLFLGHVDRKISIGVMAHALIVLGPSLNEGQGLFALEAGYFRRPLICSAIEPLTEIVIHESSGLTVPPREPAELADAIVRLENDPALQERLGENLKAKVEREFALDYMASRYVETYHSVIEG